MNSPALIVPASGGSGLSLDHLGSADLKRVFAGQHAYPVTLASASVYHAAIELFAQWLDLTGSDFEPDDVPWLPVGRVGPLPVLAHHDLSRTAPLPRAWYQPVLVSRDDYARHLRLCAPIIEAAARPDWDSGEVAAPRRRFPGVDPKLIRPTTVRAALGLLLEYFPNRRTDLDRLKELHAASGEGIVGELPGGYAGACWALQGRGAVGDATVMPGPEALVRKLSPELAGKVRILGEHARNVWVGLERLPQPHIEDLLLDELGDGWSVHFVLLDPARYLNRMPGAEPAPSGTAPGGSERASAGRPRVRIEDARNRASRSAKPAEPGVIRLTQKDIRDLDAYNPRRPDRDPLTVFLKELSAGIRHDATDLHIELGLDSYRVRARLDGCLEEWLEMPLDFGRMVIGAAKEQFGMPPERWLPQDGSCTVHHGSDVVNLRVSAFPIRGIGQKLAIRFLPRRGEVPPLHVLMPSREASLMRRAITRPYGLILLCGPTGSGKTTTTFSALAEINAPDVNITTMEDPVEYAMDGVNQAELDRSRSVDWPTLLSGFLRQDPDVGMVGEIRDRETAETAIRLSLTGHIVFATLHTMSCAHTVERLVDTGVNPQMFANAATLIVSQRLVRRLCRTCKPRGARPPTEPERKLFERHGVPAPQVVFDAVKGSCDDCRGTGYKGRVGAFEMLPITEEVAQLIAEKQPVRVLEEWMRKHRLNRVYQSALHLVARGETAVQEANQWQAVWEELPCDAAPDFDHDDSTPAV